MKRSKDSIVSHAVSRLSWRSFACLSATMCAASLMAADVIKNNNSDDLNLNTSWGSGAPPTSADVGVWNATVAGANTVNLGASTNWGGIRITNPGGPVVIWTNTAGNVLTVGASGIDMSGASQNLTLSNATTILANTRQTWKSGPGLLTIGGPLTRGAQSTINIISAAGGGINVASLTPVLGIDYMTWNGNDLVFLDSAKNVTNASAVLAYTPNPIGLTAGSASIAGTFGVVDVTNSNPAGGPSAFRLSNNLSVTNGVRFNLPNTNNVDWVMDANTRNFNFGGHQMLITSNVGPHNVIEQDTSTGFRFNGGNEWIVNQDNTQGDFIVNGHISANGTTVINITKMGAGRMIINGGANGILPSVIQQGTIYYQFPNPAASVIVQNSGVLGGFGTVSNVTVNDGGTITPGTNGLGSFGIVGSLTLGTGTPNLAFYSPGIPTTNGLPLITVNSNLTVNSTAVNISIKSGKVFIGQYPLLKWSAAIPGGTFSLFNLAQMPPHVLGYLSNNTANFSIDLVITNINLPLKWATGNGTWDIATTANWKDTFGASTTYQEGNGVGDAVMFEDTVSGSSPITVTLNTNPVPGSVVVSNITKTYTISGNGSISGSGAFFKQASGTVALATTNTFGGGINLNGGVVSFTTLANLGAGNINFGGGALQYNGNNDDISVRTVNLNAGGGTIDTVANTVSFTNGVGNNGVGGLTKMGSGTLYLNLTNRYFGETIVGQGTLAMANTNAWITNSSIITVSNSAVLDATIPALPLGGSVAQQLRGSGTVLGTVIAGTGTSISPGASAGTITVGGLNVSGGTLILDLATNQNGRDLIVVSGTLTLVNGTIQLVPSTQFTNGVYKLIQYGSLVGSPGTLTLSGFSQGGKSATLSTGSGEIDLIVADSANDNLTWSGAGVNWDLTGVQNWLKAGVPWAYTNGDTVRFDDAGAAQSSVNLPVSVQPLSVTVSNVAVATYTLNDTGGKIAGNAGITKAGSGTLVLNTLNDNSGPTDIRAGVLQVGGTLGAGNITNNGQLVFQQSIPSIIAGQISGTGPITQQGSSSLALTANNINSGQITISSGVLQVGNSGATGNLGFSAVTNGGTLSIVRTGTYALTNSVTGTGQLVVSGVGTVNLGSSLAYQGNTYISNGIVKLTASQQVPDAGAVAGSTGWLILDGGASSAGIFDLAGFNETVNAISGVAGTVNGVITNSGSSGTNTLTIGTAGTTWVGSIADSAAGAKVRVVVVGTNSVRFNGNNPYTGQTFIGESATLNVANGGNAGGGGFITISNGATLQTIQSGGGAFLGNTIIIPDGQAGNLLANSLGNGYGGAVTGGPTATNLIGANVSFSAGASTKQFQSFLGTVEVIPGGELRFSSTTTLVNGGDNTTFVLHGTLHMRNAGQAALGALGGDGFMTTMQDAASTGTQLWMIGAKGIDAVYSGSINDLQVSNQLSAITKTGVGNQVFNGIRTNVAVVLDQDTFLSYTNYATVPGIAYSGTTTVSNGVLTFIAPNNIPTNSTSITLAGASAVLDVSSAGSQTNQVDINDTHFVGGLVTNSFAITNGTLTLFGSQTLSGIGTIRGRLIQPAGTTLNVGLPTGLLTVTTNAELGGVINMTLNSTNTPNSSRFSSPTIVIDGTATLVVTNAGTNIVNGTVFQLFNQAVSGFASITLPPTNLNNGAYVWTNKLAINGTIQLLSGGLSSISLVPPTIHTVVSGTTLNMTWPPDHLGYKLQAQTNTVSVGVSTNWVDVLGSDAGTNTTITTDPTKGAVLYRLIYIGP